MLFRSAKNIKSNVQRNVLNVNYHISEYVQLIENLRGTFMLLRSPSWHTSFFISCTFALDSINNIWLICTTIQCLSETIPFFWIFFFLFSFLPTFLPLFHPCLWPCLCSSLRPTLCPLYFFWSYAYFFNIFSFFLNLILPILTPSLVNFSSFPISFLPLSSLPFSPFFPSPLLISRFSLHLFLSSSITPPFRRNQCA